MLSLNMAVTPGRQLHTNHSVSNWTSQRKTHTMWQWDTGNLAALRPSSTSDDCQDKHNSSCEAQTRGCIIRLLFKAVTTSWTWLDHTRQHTHTHARHKDNPGSKVVVRSPKQSKYNKGPFICGTASHQYHHWVPCMSPTYIQIQYVPYFVKM